MGDNSPVHVYTLLQPFFKQVTDEIVNCNALSYFVHFPLSFPVFSPSLYSAMG